MRKLFVLGRMASSFGATSFQVSTHCRIIPRSSILQSSTSRAWSGYTEHSFMDGARIYETEIAIAGAKKAAATKKHRAAGIKAASTREANIATKKRSGAAKKANDTRKRNAAAKKRS